MHHRPMGLPGKAFITRVNAAGGNAQLLYPPDLGIHGNTHMIMQDKNNL